MASKSSSKSPNMVKPLFLAIVLCALGGLAYWLEYGRKPKQAVAEADAKKVFVLGKSAVSQLEFRGVSVKPENASNPPLAVTVACESLAANLCKPDDNSKWQMLAPLKTKADENAVNGLLKNFGNLTSVDSVDLSSETPEKRAQLLKDYGLDAAARTNPKTRAVSVTLSGGPRLTAFFGERHPIGDNVFALLMTGDAPNENRIYIVPDWQLSVFDQKTSFFRDKTLFGLDEKEISSFTLATSKKVDGKLLAKRNPDEKGWQLRLGAQEFEGDVDTIDGILSGVTHLAAKDILADSRETAAAKAALSGAKNTYDLQFTGKTGEYRIRFYEKKKDPKGAATVYAIVDGQDPVYELEIYVTDKLEKTLDEMRVGKLISVTERYAITAIDIEAHAAESFKQHLVKETGGKWKIGGTESARGKVEDLLDRLSSKVVIAHSGPAPSGDFLKMVFRKSSDSKEPPVAEIEFWSTKGRLYAKNLSSPKKEVVELAPDFNSSLPWKAATLFEEKGSGK